MGTIRRIRLSRFPSEVPLLPGIDYDFRGLNDFPTRHDITSDELRDLDNRPVEDSASLVQSWLFFGLLAELTGMLVDRQSILHPDARQRKSKLRIASSSEGSKSRISSQKIRDIVQIGVDNVELIDRLDCAWEYPMPIVLLSIKILLCDLAAMRVDRSKIYSSPWDGGLEEPRLLPCPPGAGFRLSSAKALEGLMLAKGWCPSQVHRIGWTCDYSMMHYLSSIDRTSNEKRIHGSCSPKHCQAYNSAPESYVTSHTVSGCQCSFMVAPTEQLTKVISSGGVPLISLHEASHGKLAIQVHTSKADSQYTAISHVWSGGLGNVQANSLPLCQLNYLNHCLSNLPIDGERGFNYKKNKYYRDLCGKIWISPLGLDNLVSSKNCKPKLFWMDTLCIPVDPESSDLRIKAINKMDAVYAHAGEVLVLDSEIQNLSISDTHPCELVARLANSSWMGRSWTLQEGAIGRATYFQCTDGALTFQRSRLSLGQKSPLLLLLLMFRSVRSMIRHKATKISYSETSIRQNIGHERVENVMLKVLLDSLHRGRNTKTMTDWSGLIPDKVQLDSFVSVWNELIKRSTTKSDDIFAIFANLLDFTASQIIKLPRDERMKGILWSSTTIPFSLLYNTGPRLKDGDNRRDRWVPTVPKGSRLTKSPSMKFAEGGHSFCLTVGEVETQPLALIAEVDSLPLYSNMLDIESDKRYFVKAIRSVNDITDPVTHQAICIVMEQLPEEEGGGFDQYASKFARRIRGACLHVTSMRSSSTTIPEGHARGSTQSSETLPNNRTILATIYNCPMRIWEVNATGSIPESETSAFEKQDRSIGCPTIQCKSLRPGYELHLEIGTCNVMLSHIE